jgi:hypothetical protein
MSSSRSIGLGREARVRATAGTTIQPLHLADGWAAAPGRCASAGRSVQPARSADNRGQRQPAGTASRSGRRRDQSIRPFHRLVPGHRHRLLASFLCENDEDSYPPEAWVPWLLGVVDASQPAQWRRLHVQPPQYPGAAPLKATSPRVSTTCAAFVSAGAPWPHATHRNHSRLLRLSAATCPHLEQVWEECAAWTSTRTPPFEGHL